MKYVKRNIEETIIKAAKQFPALIVTGPRQSGKTTLLKHLFSKTHHYVSLDDPDVRLMANQDPGLFLKNHPAPVIIDEVQYAPGLFSFLKIQIDQKRTKKGQFLLTGSQSFPLMAKVGESLAGRIAVFTLLSFSVKEQMQDSKRIDQKNLKTMVLRGGYPEIAIDKKIDLKLWFNGYLQTYLERDVRNLRQIGDLTDYQRFLELLAALDGQVLRLSEISRDLGVAVNTVKAWVSILEACNQIYLVKPFYKNKGKRIIKSPKIYFLDTGFLCFLTGITSREQIFKGPLAGRLLENVVLGEILRNFLNKGELPKVFWWRTSYGEEVDFVMEREGKIYPIEVKLSSRTNKELAAGLISFSKLFKGETGRAYLVNFAEKRSLIAEGVECCPIADFLR
ncbi:MAG: ATP-binding protein [Candidatus Omnitrophota bacterium]